jgi:hypothetical protein
MILGFGSSRIGRPLNKNLSDSWKDSIFYNFKTNTMTELTIEMAMDISNKTSYKDWVKHFRPEWTDEQCEFYLWEYTCFPFGFKEIIKQLNEQLLNQTQ